MRNAINVKLVSLIATNFIGRATEEGNIHNIDFFYFTITPTAAIEQISLRTVTNFNKSDTYIAYYYDLILL